MTASRGSSPGADAKVFATGKKFCGRYISPWTAAPGCGYLSPPESPAAGNRPVKWRQKGSDSAIRRCALHPGRFTAGMQGAQDTARQATGGWAAHPFTDAASRVFTHQTVASARNRASGFGGAWRVRQHLPGGVGLMIGQCKLVTSRR
ncbi:TPA: hypothetical protein G8O67_004989 [Salmonella enterica]|uniref:Uncharacterized protein n=1 Tax=Salmonella enterica TaxID=28901 RepID=A0A756LA00_SALER|nr:hypothetical protein [Salmonella enterica]